MKTKGLPNSNNKSPRRGKNSSGVSKPLSISPSIPEPKPKNITLSDGGKGVVAGGNAYRRLESGQLVRLGAAQEDGSILPIVDKKKRKKND